MSTTGRSGRWWAALGLAVTLGASAVHAGEADHERARQAVEAGEILPLARILDRVERDYPGSVVEVELEREHGRWHYEVKLLQRDGRVLKLDVDAGDARVLSVKGGGHAESRPEGKSR